MTRRAPPGQAAVELIAAVPVLIAAALVAWQLVAVLGAGQEAERRVRADAIRAAASPGGTATTRATVAVPAVLPGMAGLRVTARATVRTP